MKELETTVMQQDTYLLEFNLELNEKNHQIEMMEMVSPIKVFGKVSGDKMGATSWPY